MISAQLSLFNVAKTAATSYKVGDWVKLRKKPIAASYVKKGDIVKAVIVRQKKERIGRNPQTGAEIQIAASKQPKFSAGSKLKDAVNG